MYDSNATQSMTASQSSHWPLEEEAIYTSFEQAISERVSALQGQLRRLNNPKSAASQQRRSAGDRVARVSKTCLCLLEKGRMQCVMILTGLALIFSLIGFDLMGLLVLSLR